MNVLLEDALAAGPESSEFYLLLKNYGIWSRYFGCIGYKSQPSESGPVPVIDDDTAMMVEQGVIRLRKSRPNVYKIFRLHYVYDCTPEVIVGKIRRESSGNREPRHVRRHNYFEYSPVLDGALRHINASCVRDLLKISETFIFDQLLRIENKL